MLPDCDTTVYVFGRDAVAAAIAACSASSPGGQLPSWQELAAKWTSQLPTAATNFSPARNAVLAQLFLRSMAQLLKIEFSDANRIVHAAVAAHTRARLLDSLAIIKQVRRVNTLPVLSVLLLVAPVTAQKLLPSSDLDSGTVPRGVLRCVAEVQHAAQSVLVSASNWSCFQICLQSLLPTRIMHDAFHHHNQQRERRLTLQAEGTSKRDIARGQMQQLAAVVDAFPLPEHSPEMELVYSGLKGFLVYEDRLLLYKAYRKATDQESSRHAMADALGMMY